MHYPGRTGNIWLPPSLFLYPRSTAELCNHDTTTYGQWFYSSVDCSIHVDHVSAIVPCQPCFPGYAPPSRDRIRWEADMEKIETPAELAPVVCPPRPDGPNVHLLVSKSLAVSVPKPRVAASLPRNRSTVTWHWDGPVGDSGNVDSDLMKEVTS